jgi:hypothetical protein
MKTILKVALLFILLMPAASRAQMPAAAAITPKDIVLAEDMDPDLVKNAGNSAIRAAVADFMARQDMPIKRYAILPLERDVDGGYFTMQFRNEFASHAGTDGYELYTRMGDDWNNILNEIAWGQTYGDTMDPATVQKFGRIQGVQGLIMGRISSVDKYGGDDVKVRFSMQVFEVETGRLLWGEEKVAYGRGTGDWTVDWLRLSRKQYMEFGLIGLGCILALAILAKIGGAMRRAARPR